ncbi:MAG: glycosyltransferase [Desulfuromonadales bacterium]|nr:glycosyltransferase [Desulfuromonadales bacterium]
MSSSKVLHLVLKGDGLTEVVAEDINIGLLESGADVTMVYLRDKEGILQKTVANHTVSLGLRSRFKLLFDWFAFRRLSALLIQDKFDVVISHRYKPCLLAMKLARKFPEIEFINVVHGTGHYDKASRKRAILRLTQEKFRFVCVSNAVAEFMRNRCGLATTLSPVEVISNGIDIEGLDAQQLSREEARKALGLDASSVWIGFVGRLIRIKGVSELVEGFAQVARDYPFARLAILGKGALGEELQRLIDSHQLQERVLLLGHVPMARRYFKAFDGFILPSYREGMSISLLEAMATGLPLLVSDIPMNTSLVNEGAVVFSPGDSFAISEALASFLDRESSQRQADGYSNRLLAEKNYSIHLFRQNYAALVRRLVNSG